MNKYGTNLELQKNYTHFISGNLVNGNVLVDLGIYELLAEFASKSSSTIPFSIFSSDKNYAQTVAKIWQQKYWSVNLSHRSSRTEQFITNPP